MKRVDIKIGFHCNNYCRFCVQGNKRTMYSNKNILDIKRILDTAREDCDSVVFTGGEPTVRADIIELVGYAKKLNFDTIQIQTNGRMFCYEKFCDEIIAAGANEFSPAVHGHIAELHDYLTRAPGSFKQTITGIKNLKNRGRKIIVNTVVTKPNYRNLPQIAQLLVYLGVDQFQFAFVHALGSAKENFESIVPRIALVKPYIRKGLDIGIRAGRMVMTEAIPYCFMEGYESYIAEKIIPPTKIYDATRIIEDFSKTRKKEGKLKGPNCKKCLYYIICEGPWKEYPKSFGWGEFKPVNRMHKITLGQNKIEGVIKDVFDLLIEKNNLIRYSNIIHRMRTILFSNFNTIWLFKNQKFDFSFSGNIDNKGSLRFSYNNFGEKKHFEEKIEKIFNLFDEEFFIEKLDEVLAYMKLTDDRHQTTIGLEWPEGSIYPKFKIYFEELAHRYSHKEILYKLKKICGILNISFEKLQIGRNNEIAAICVDFLPKRLINLKVYLLYNCVNKKELSKIPEMQNVRSDGKFLSSFMDYIIDETKSFYYVTKRFAANGEVLSLKLYKIYEVNQISHFNKAILEIERFLKKIKLNRLLSDLSQIKDMCTKKGVSLMPVIAAVDTSKKRDKIDIYLSFK